MPRTFLVKTFKKKEGKHSAEVRNCTIVEESTHFENKICEQLIKNQAADEIHTTELELEDAKTKKEITKTAIFMPDNASKFSNRIAKDKCISRPSGNDVTGENFSRWSDTSMRKHQSEAIGSDDTGNETKSIEENRRGFVNNGIQEDSSIYDNMKHSVIKRPIALFAEQCHCNDCFQSNSKLALYNRNARGHIDSHMSSGLHVKHAHSVGQGDEDRAILQRLIQNKNAYFYYYDDADMNKQRYSEYTAFHDGPNSGYSFNKHAQKSLEVTRYNGARFKLSVDQKGIENGRVSSDSPARVNYWSRNNMRDGGSMAAEVEEGDLKVRLKNQMKANRRLAALEKTRAKFEHVRLFSLRKELKNKTLNRDNGKSSTKLRKSEFAFDYEDIGGHGKFATTKRGRFDAENEIDKNNIKDKIYGEKEFYFSKEITGKWKIQRNSEFSFKDVEIKVENSTDDEEWCTEQQESGSMSPDYNMVKDKIMEYRGMCCNKPDVDDKKPVGKNGVRQSLISESEEGKSWGCEVSPEYNIKEEQSIKFNDGLSKSSDGMEFQDDDDKMEGRDDDLEEEQQDLMAKNEMSRDTKSKEKRALAKRQREKDSGRKSRAVANWLERKRVAELNEAFELLRKIVPTYGNEDRSLSKIKTLRYASKYINHLAMIYEKQCRYGLHDIKQGLVNLLEMDPLIQRCQEHLETRCVI